MDPQRAPRVREPGVNRNPVQREQDYVTEAAMYLERHTLDEIGQAVGISRDQVSYDINKVLIPRWMAASQASVAQHMAEELARINRLEETYWRAWERSLTDREVRFSSTTDRTRTVQVPAAVQQAMLAQAQQLQMTTTLPSGETKASMTREGRDGNPLFLMGIQWCIERRCKLLGLDAPVKIDIEAHIRSMAVTLGLDPELALREAQEVLQAARQRSGFGGDPEPAGGLLGRVIDG